MIYTVTLNPAIDYVVTLDQLEVGTINRIQTEQFYAGGKGINVSRILNEHQLETIALGFISGFTGMFIERSLHETGVKTDFTHLGEGYSRINLKAKSRLEETEVNGVGPKVSAEAMAGFYEKLQRLEDGDTLVLAGSLALGLPEDFYEQIMNRLSHKNIKVVVDATKNTLLRTLKNGPFLIKPNHHEVSELFNVKVKTRSELLYYGRRLQEMGAENVLISRGKEGALLLAANGAIYDSNVPQGVVKNSVGAGDSMVAGFLAGYMKTKDYGEALRLGAASGSATAFSRDVAKACDIEALLPQIVVTKLTT